ncbi:MAG: transcription-repair coupling factor [Lachnospiraceae bacterium]|nr:transcription-repair coupling factor [Candidatus Colinaster equi]
MNAILNSLTEWADYSRTRENLLKKKQSVAVFGCIESQKVHMAEALSDGSRFRIIATYSEERVNKIVEDLRLYTGNVCVYPAKDLIFYQADIHNNKLVTERIRAIKKLAEKMPVVLVTTFDALLTPVVPLETYVSNTIKLLKGAETDVKKLATSLVNIGYERTHQVEEPGQFAIRGDIIDIFDLTEDNPIRIELWGDEIETIRSFDVDSQRSVEELQRISIFPASEIILTEDELKNGLHKVEKDAKELSKKFREEFLTEESHRIDVTFKTLKEDLEIIGRMTNLDGYINYFYDKLDYLLQYAPLDNSVLIIDEPGRVKEHIAAIEYEFEESMKTRLSKGYILPGQLKMLGSLSEMLSKCKGIPILMLSTLEERGTFIKADYKTSIEAKSISTYKNHFELLLSDLEKYKKNGYRVVLICPSRTRARRLAKDISDNDLPAIYTDDVMREPISGEILCIYGNMLKGFEYPLLKIVYISESDIFGRDERKKKKRKVFEGRKIRDFGELKVGDYVVHETHGLGIYKGIEKVEVEKVTKDYMKIEYRDGGILYILATGFDVIQKYASVDAAKKPKLSKLGTKEWTNTKAKVKSSVDEIAKELVDLYAARSSAKGFEYSKDTVWQSEFEEMFPYEETDDQLQAIADTKRDMESDRVMDRLICGDVGYGKTEIAIRAAFKAVSDGKQVALLVPTTILASQHYNTFTQRMKDFPVRVEVMSRFQSTAKIKEILKGLKEGAVDIVIGTHRLLSADVVFRDLGLLVVDEEQRFGVTHKEKIKKLKENVDVLALSATPIPRTLHMSLVGIRDMSVLEEAPGERLPIQTFVCEYNEQMVREAIIREKSRGGQVYYVYNRVNNIADVAASIQALVPEVNVSFAHGQMKETELENIMYDFVDGDIDVLVSTTIIETGLDISNVNTIIIHDSDRLGLSQLYQLRGRVGRTNKTAYAFLMYKRDRMLKEEAEKRLEAIREFTDLGSGFRIAMRDLEIRGAGNLLGFKQHGHMEAVGYDLYCKMLNDAVNKLKGKQSDAEDFNTQIDLDVDAYIPADYIVNEVQKLDIYKRIASIESNEEATDMEAELRDRFGKVPNCVHNLLTITLLKVMAHKVFVTDVKGSHGRIKLTMRPDAAIKVEKIPDLMIKQGKNLKFVPKGVPYFTYKYYMTDVVSKDEEMLITCTRSLLNDMIELLV